MWSTSFLHYQLFYMDTATLYLLSWPGCLCVAVRVCTNANFPWTHLQNFECENHATELGSRDLNPQFFRRGRGGISTKFKLDCARKSQEGLGTQDKPSLKK